MKAKPKATSKREPAKKPMKSAKRAAKPTPKRAPATKRANKPAKLAAGKPAASKSAAGKSAAKQTSAKPAIANRAAEKEAAMGALERHYLSSSPAVVSALAKVRTFALGLPDISEKSSHGSPTFFHKKGVVAYFLDNHHNDGRLALWLPAEPGMQTMLIESNPEVYFKPPYVGPSGWVGIRLDRDAEWSQIESLLEAAAQRVASKRR